MKTLNFIKRKRRGAGRAQPGPDETLGRKVCALTGRVTNVLPLLELESGGPHGCVMSARPTFPTGTGHPDPVPTSKPSAGSHSQGSSVQGRGVQGVQGQTQLVRVRGPLNLGGLLEEKEF